MGLFSKGEVVIVNYPFSDLSSTKVRPALIIADCGMNDYLMCQITTINNRDTYAIKLTNNDFLNGALNQDSNIRPNKIMTLNEAIIRNSVGQLKTSKYDDVAKVICDLIK